ncbi:phosphonate metabolism transcriptional regulator PhnF [Rhodobacter veldkampii DSM 11550]|uniref:Phosphonate metabolism transcriptional regulator PhnF n=1 Tax=Phaeovulum veldkampii DSM 11550 TaxID=1185920 RepID=A0A2T4JD34_9RHOB|nr:phosphonate metabolism transcriptional regulator PhnF [Phaeovulum veldkampii]MBK5946150.1 phosphonate metabolism transcriptional regulator PhnF [Phaeovulum veldkampii DSM 11550]PTE15820.1 phosphonate metabolism transcriptional regulator PhnF [Phaeovulum veldkampii DSM 11550]TDQ56541.1 GntR family phosphonate transport system transcriptional regulator [Phaeovulum veldkampii DSM 11550]
MPRTPIWKSIAATLDAEIAADLYRPGDRLPTEAELAARFGVNRHTIRHALADMGARGIVHSRRGAGVFVAARPLDYAIGRRVRFHQNLAAAGHLPERTILRMETRRSEAREAEALALPAGAMVHVHEGVSSADGAPILMFRSVFPADRFPDLPAALTETGSVTAALARGGVADYTRAVTRLTAKLATAMQALHLRIAEGAPILRSVAINVDGAGRPVEYGHTWFAGDRVTLTMTPD